MAEPWTFFTWEDIYAEHKYIVQTILKDEPDTRRIMNFIVYCVSCEAANRIEEHCLNGLKQMIDEFKEKNPGNEPEECDWLDFVFHYSGQYKMQEKLLEDEVLKEDLAGRLEADATTISNTIITEYNLLINARIKATMKQQDT